MKTEKNALAVTVMKQSTQIHTLTEKLTALQKLHKALENKFNRVMRFIESMHLKEKLDAFFVAEHIDSPDEKLHVCFGYKVFCKLLNK